MSGTDPLLEASSICIGCGLCCDGNLHPHTIVEAGDEENVRNVGLSVVESRGERCFAQPCPKFSGGVCTVYDRRPNSCRRYRCKLLKNVEEGRVSAPEARSRIAIAKSLIATACFDAAESATAAGRAALAKELHEKGSDVLEAAGRKRAARMLLNLSAVDYVLERWFLFKKSDREGNLGAPSRERG